MWYVNWRTVNWLYYCGESHLTKHNTGSNNLWCQKQESKQLGRSVAVKLPAQIFRIFEYSSRLLLCLHAAGRAKSSFNRLNHNIMMLWPLAHCTEVRLCYNYLIMTATSSWLRHHDVMNNQRFRWWCIVCRCARVPGCVMDGNNIKPRSSGRTYRIVLYTGQLINIHHFTKAKFGYFQA